MTTPQKKDAKARKRPSRVQIAGRAAGKGWSAFVPTDQDRQTVLLAVAVGMPQERIAKQVRFPDGIKVDTLKKHFAKELECGEDRANLSVAGALFTTAITSAHKSHAAAAIFWMKTRARWSEEGGLGAVSASVTDQTSTGTRTFTLKIGERSEPEVPGEDE